VRTKLLKRHSIARKPNAYAQNIESEPKGIDEEEMEKIFRICLVGCGGMAVHGHGPSLVKYQLEHTGVVLAGCCDLITDKAEQFKTQFGFLHAYTDHKEMLETEKPDLTLCLTPPQITAGIAIDILSRGCNVLLEKPPGLDRKEAMAIHNAALASGASARVAFNRRYIPLVMGFKKEIKESRILGITCDMMRMNRLDEDFSTTAIHGIDTVKYIVDSEYETVQITQTPFTVQGKTVKNIGLQGQLKNGMFCSLHFFPCSGEDNEIYRVITTDKTFRLELPSHNNPSEAGKITIIEKNTVFTERKGPVAEIFVNNGFYGETAGFACSLCEGAKLGSDIDTGITSVEIADCIRKNMQHYSN
jgi:predicted dehydrogenase